MVETAILGLIHGNAAMLHQMVNHAQISLKMVYVIQLAILKLAFLMVETAKAKELRLSADQKAISNRVDLQVNILIYLRVIEDEV